MLRKGFVRTGTAMAAASCCLLLAACGEADVRSAAVGENDPDGYSVMEAVYDPSDGTYGEWEESMFPASHVLGRYGTGYVKKKDGAPSPDGEAWDAYALVEGGMPDADSFDPSGAAAVIYDTGDGDEVCVKKDGGEEWFSADD